MKSITNLIKEIGLEDLICNSFDEAKNNNRRKNIVVLDDVDIYLTYKYHGEFGELACWVSDEFEEDERVYDSMIEWVKDIFYRKENEIDYCIFLGELMFDFKPY